MTDHYIPKGERPDIVLSEMQKNSPELVCEKWFDYVKQQWFIRSLSKKDHEKQEQEARKRREATKSTFSNMRRLPCDLPEYVSPVTGKPVDGRAARREDLKRSGCREVEPSEFRAEYTNERFIQKHGIRQ